MGCHLLTHAPSDKDQTLPGTCGARPPSPASAHPPSTTLLLIPPPTAPAPPAPLPPPRSWQEGKCHYGPTCKYAHGEGDLRAPGAGGPRPAGMMKPVVKNTAVHKTKLCERFMATGACPYGPKCTFAHGWVAAGAVCAAGAEREQSGSPSRPRGAGASVRAAMDGACRLRPRVLLPKRRPAR